MARRRTWLRRVLRCGLATVVGAVLLLVSLVVGVVWYVHTQDFQDRVTAWLTALIEKQTGERASIDRVVVSFFPPGADVEGLRLWHEATGDDIVTVDRVSAPLRWGDTIGVSDLVIDRPNIVLHVDADGLREFRNLPKSEGEGLAELPWQTLNVESGSFELIFPGGYARIRDLDVDPTAGFLHDIVASVRWRYGRLEDGADIDVRDVQIGQDRFEVPTLALDARAFDVTAHASYALGGAIDGEVSADGVLNELGALLPEGWALDGRFHLDLDIRGEPSDPRLEGNALVTAPTATSPGGSTYEIDKVVAAIRAGLDGVQVDSAELHGRDGFATATGFVGPDGTLREVTVLGENLSLAHWLQATSVLADPTVDLRTDAEVVLSGTLSPLALVGTIDLAIADLIAADRPLSDPRRIPVFELPWIAVDGRVELSPEGVHLRRGHIRTPRNAGTFEVHVPFGPGAELDLPFDLTTADLSDFGPLGGAALAGQGTLTEGRLYGPFNALQVRGYADLAGFSAVGIPFADRLHGQVTSDLDGLIVSQATGTHGVVGPDGIYTATTVFSGEVEVRWGAVFELHTDLTVHEGSRIEDAVGMFLDLPGLTGRFAGPLTLHGPIDRLDGGADFTLSRLSLFGEHLDAGRFRGFMDDGRFTLDDLRGTRRSGREGLLLRGTVGPAWAVDMEVVADGVELASADSLVYADGTRPALEGTVAFVGRVEGTLFEPEPEGRLSLDRLRFAGQPIDSSSVDLRTADGVLHADGRLLGGAARAAGYLDLWRTRDYSIRANVDQLPLHSFYRVAMDGRPITATVTGDIGIDGDLSGGWPQVIARGSEVLFDWGGHRLTNGDTPWQFEQVGPDWVLTNARIASADGTESVSLTARGDADGTKFDGRGSLSLDLLRAIVPGLTRAEGTAEVAISNPRGEVQVRVEVEDAPLVRHDAFPAALEGVSATLIAKQDGYQILGFTANVGGGEVVAKPSRIDARRWIPRRFDLAFVADDILVKWNDTLPPALADASLRFDGPPGGLLLSGRVDVSEMTFSDRIDWEDWVIEIQDSLLVTEEVDESAKGLFALEIDIEADRTIHLVNNVAEATASASLRVIGNTDRSGMEGRVEVDGNATVQDREFRIERGVIAFDDPWSWDPELDFDLQAEVSSQRGRYRVSYLIYGPLSGWTSETRSDPPLPQADVNALVWYGVTTDDLENMGQLGTSLGISGLDLLATDTSLRWASEYRGLQSLFVDRIDLVTGVDVRGEYNANPRLLVKKRLPPLAEATFELDPFTRDYFFLAERELFGQLSLSGWYSTRQRERVSPFGAFGLDFRGRWEFE